VTTKLKKPRKFIRTRVHTNIDGALCVDIGVRLRNSENGGNMHWGEKATHKDKFNKAVIGAGTTRPLAVTRMTFVRWAPGVFDDDALPASFKWFRDAAVKWLGLSNDSPTCGVSFAYEQYKQPEYGVRIVFA
jgi:hypothetical protein